LAKANKLKAMALAKAAKIEAAVCKKIQILCAPACKTAVSTISGIAKSYGIPVTCISGALDKGCIKVCSSICGKLKAFGEKKLNEGKGKLEAKGNKLKGNVTSDLDQQKKK